MAAASTSSWSRASPRCAARGREELLVEHDLLRKPAPIPDRGRGHAFRDHALIDARRPGAPVAQAAEDVAAPCPAGRRFSLRRLVVPAAPGHAGAQLLARERIAAQRLAP